MKTRILSIFAIATLVGGGLFVAPPVTRAATGTLSFAVSGGLSHTVGDTITITPTGNYAFVGGFICVYTLVIQQPLAPNSPMANDSSISTSAASVGGICPAWTFRLPNLAQMAYYSTGASTSMAASVCAVGSANEDNICSGIQFITYAPSSAAPTSTSTLPAVLWTLTNTKASAGQSVTAQITTLNFPWRCSASYNHASTSVTTAYSGSASCASITFTQAFPGTWLTISSDPDGITGLGALSQIWAQDPKALEQSPSPSASPSPEPSASPTPSDSPSTSPSPSATPTPEPSASPTPTPSPAPVVTPTPRPTVKPTATPKPTVKPAVAPTVRFVSAPLRVVAGAKTYYKATATACGTGCRYTWIADNGHGSVIADTRTPSVIYLVFSPGRHTLLVRATSSNGLTDSVQVAIVAVTPTPKPTVAPTVKPTPKPTVTPTPTFAPTPTPTVVPSASATPTVAPTVVKCPPPTNDQSGLWVALGALGWLLALLFLLLLLFRRRRKDEESPARSDEANLSLD